MCSREEIHNFVYQHNRSRRVLSQKNGLCASPMALLHSFYMEASNKIFCLFPLLLTPNRTAKPTLTSSTMHPALFSLYCPPILNQCPIPLCLFSHSICCKQLETRTPFLLARDLGAPGSIVTDTLRARFWTPHANTDMPLCTAP